MLNFALIFEVLTMTEQKYVDVVKAQANEISWLMDQGSAIAVSEALRASYRIMSPADFYSLLETINRTPQDNVSFQFWL